MVIPTAVRIESIENIKSIIPSNNNCNIITIKPGKLLAVDFVQGKAKAILFIFDGGLLNKKQIETITLPPKELSEFKFVPEKEALKLLRPRGAKPLPKVMSLIKTINTLYFEDNKPHLGISEK